MSAMVRLGIFVGLLVLVAGLCFAFGLIGDQKPLIGVGLLLLALSGIYGANPHWPARRRPD